MSAAGGILGVAGGPFGGALGAGLLACVSALPLLIAGGAAKNGQLACATGLPSELSLVPRLN